MNKTSLILCIHNHQPVGNLPWVFESAYRDAYRPFLDSIEQHPDIKLVLHTTGPLLEWCEANAPGYLEKTKRLVSRGQVELLTGGFYEPILTAIPEEDRVGQIEKLTEYTESVFGTRPRGMWLAERVWDPHLASTLARAGVEYVPLDDYEFRLSGLPDEELVGYFLTEDEGNRLAVFPISKKLRYAIPFAPPEDTVAILRSVAERAPGLVLVLGDDGEKFGVWPGTHKHVYGDRWLERFLTALTENSDWLETVTFSEFVDREPPRGRAYLPTSSYPEMMEWALPTPARRSYEKMQKSLTDCGSIDEWGPYLSGGTWMGFLAKYTEANEMHKKMLRVSRKVSRAVRSADSDPPRNPGSRAQVVEARAVPAHGNAALADARNELWRGQCNCAYWHGVFGGLYLPHLRSAVYGHLIRAENALEQTKGERWSELEVVDHDADGHLEVLLENHAANVYVAPAHGGRMFELDIRGSEHNLLATMSRYEEAYHGELERLSAADDPGGTAVSIHDAVTAKEEGLAKLLTYDAYPRKAAIDHFYSIGTGVRDLASGAAPDLADFADSRYEFEPWIEDGAVGVTLCRDGMVEGRGGKSAVTVEKQVRLSERDGLTVLYRISADCRLDAEFASEWNLAYLTNDRKWTFLEPEGGGLRGLGESVSIRKTAAVSITDLLIDEVVTVGLEPEGGVWTWPLETVSQSEGGLERVFQGLTIVPHWSVRLAAGGEATFKLSLVARGRT